MSTKDNMKKRTRIGNAVKTELYENLQELSEKTRIPISKLLDEAIEDLLNKHKN